MAKSPEEMAASMIANLEEKTGKSLAEWVKIAKASKLAKHGEVVKHLKTEHGLTHGYANLVAHTHLGSSAMSSSGGDLIAAQYAGKKAELRPIYDALMNTINGFGKDVEVSPKKAYVSLRRNKQFATIQPSTATRIDVGLCLKGTAGSGRLEDVGAGAMVSHKVRVTSKGDIDAELKGWLKRAYDAS